MSAKPIPMIRWVLAVVVLVLVFALLLSKSIKPELPAEDAAAVAQTPVTEPSSEPSTEATTDPLPALESLQRVNLDKAPARRSLDLQHWTTDEGARVYFMQAAELPMLDLQLLFAAGASRDGTLPGLAMVTNGMLNEGIEGMDSGAIAAGFEKLGAEYDNSSHRDMALAGLRSLTATDKLQPALDLFTRVVSQPGFPVDAFERLRNQLQASLQMRLQSPGALGSEAFWAGLYPEHPYGSLPSGTPESLALLTPDILNTFHGEYYTAGNAVIAMVGDIDKAEAERIASRLSRALPQGPAAAPVAQPDQVTARHEHVVFNSQQTHILLGQLGINRQDPDYAALYVGNQMLGGSGFGSRLMEQIREERGLSYSVSSSLVPMQAAGPFQIGMQTRNDQVELALEVIDATLNEFVREGPTETELVRTKRQIMGQFPLSTASNDAIVGQLGMIGFYGLPLNHMQLFLDQVEKLEIEDVREAFQQLIDPQRRLIVTVGPEPVLAEVDEVEGVQATNEVIVPDEPLEPTE
ncbi:pitrilysin family protein [uncultured Halopseudomonas sp.]|uniref:M16 family metallopeptidase n=1 Tax=uncultured Halopseudomonas sp. TaxID=2901193 RepID=UPI0030EE9CBF|tara:strand:- start:19075 stop:20640 length:1566 start_codon:yes stop_codon:yes gene_type:complete